jgi:hypothetical protein
MPAKDAMAMHHTPTFLIAFEIVINRGYSLVSSPATDATNHPEEAKQKLGSASANWREQDGSGKKAAEQATEAVNSSPRSVGARGQIARPRLIVHRRDIPFC